MIAEAPKKKEREEQKGQQVKQEKKKVQQQAKRMVRVGLELTASRFSDWRSNSKRPKKIPLGPLEIEQMAKSTRDGYQRSRNPKEKTMVPAGIELATGTVEETHSPTKRDPE